MKRHATSATRSKPCAHQGRAEQIKESTCTYDPCCLIKIAKANREQRFHSNVDRCQFRNQIEIIFDSMEKASSLEASSSATGVRRAPLSSPSTAFGLAAGEEEAAAAPQAAVASTAALQRATLARGPGGSPAAARSASARARSPSALAVAEGLHDGALSDQAGVGDIGAGTAAVLVALAAHEPAILRVGGAADAFKLCHVCGLVGRQIACRAVDAARGVARDPWQP